MLEKYASAINKIRRIDDLKDELRALKGEDGKLSSSAMVYRKKNDWREKAGNDDAISRINERRTTVSKREALVKAEIKSLRNEVYDLLSECFAEAKSEEHRAKVREACIYASDGRYVISEVGKTPSSFGKCIIVGKRYTSDESKDGRVEKLVRGGIKNTSGRFLIFPEVVVYAYDKYKTEGEYVATYEKFSRGGKIVAETPIKEIKKIEDFTFDETSEEYPTANPGSYEAADSTESYDYGASGEKTEYDYNAEPAMETTDVKPDATEPETKKSEPIVAPTQKADDRTNETLEAVKEKFVNRSSLVALLFAVVWAGFFLWATLIGVDKNTFWETPLKFAVVYFGIAMVSAIAAKGKNEVFALFSLYGGALSAFCLAASRNPLVALPLPVAMFVGGLISTFISASAKNKSANADTVVLLEKVAFGVWAAFLARSLFGQIGFDLFYVCSASAVGAIAILCAALLFKAKDPAAKRALKGYAIGAAAYALVVSFAFRVEICVIIAVGACALIAAVEVLFGNDDV